MSGEENSQHRLGDIAGVDVAEGSGMEEDVEEEEDEETTSRKEEDEEEEVHWNDDLEDENEIPTQQSKNEGGSGSLETHEDEGSQQAEGFRATKGESLGDAAKEKKWQVQWPYEDERESVERRKSIYELDSYVASNISMLENVEGDETSATDLDGRLGVRYSVSLGMPGIARIDLSPLTQKIVGCVIGENVTTEYPWVYVRKEIIEDNLDLHSESSDFLPVKSQVEAFSDKSMLIGYAPSSTEKGQFYICLNESGMDAVVRHIETLRLQQEDRVKNAASKSPGKWTDLGSGEEVDDTIARKTRPLFEIEVESTSDLVNAAISLIDRNSNDQRDGYVELLPYRQTFDNVTRRLVSKGEQASPARRDSDAQTRPSMLFNSWFQYNYEYTPVNTTAYNEDETDAMKKFLRKYTNDVCDKVQQNSTWDIYTDDYANLVRNARDTQAPVAIAYTEHQSYYDEKLSTDKVINGLCWHPLWTGIAAAAYSEHCKSDSLVGPDMRDEVLSACEGNNQVLIWSFNDCLTPKLVLECPREVTAVSICPLDGNVIVGGCASGQIAIWSIPGKIEQVEAVMVQTTAQVKYRIAMRSLMSWMREATSSTVVKPAAMSSLQYSHKAPVTEIVWLPIYDRVDRNGRITSLPADSKLDELGWQLATSSEDGTIAFWDLRWRPNDEKIKSETRGGKKKKAARRPDPLVQSISPFKPLDGIFRPEYTLEVIDPDEDRRAVVTAMSVYNPKIAKEQTEPFPLGRDDITERKYYRPVIAKPDYQLEATILIGTLDGDVARVAWDGYEFTTGADVNRETVRWLWSNRNVHDGPVTHVARSKYLRDVFATVGGKAFAIWREDFGEPVFWRKSNIRYTACCWGTFRPTVLILARGDGTAEIWDFIVKSHEPSFTQGVSGRIITGIHTHELYLNPQCVAFCDFNGTLRVFTAPANLLNFDESDIEWMRKFVDREVDRIREFKNWQKLWNETDAENVEKRRKLAELEAEKKRLEAEEKIRAEMAEMLEKQKRAKTAKTNRKPGEFLEEAKDRWKAMELKRMQQVILEKKGLSADVLDKQRAPVLQLRRDAKRKRQKIREIMQHRDKIFEDTTAFLFPEQYRRDRRSTYGQRLSVSRDDDDEDMTAEMKVLMDEEPTRKFVSPEEEIIHDFTEVESEALASMRKNPYEPNFEWRKVLAEGKVRRRSMDVKLTRGNRPGGRKFSQEAPEVCEPSTDRNTASGPGGLTRRPTDADVTDP